MLPVLLPSSQDDPRQIGTVVLGVPLATQRPIATGGGLLAVAVVVDVLGLGLPGGRGRVKDDHVDLEVQQARDAEEHRFLHALGAVQQEVHRALQLIIGDRVDAVDDHVAAQPACRLQLGRRVQDALAYHREDRALDHRAAAPGAGDPADRLADTQLRPQPADHVRAAGLQGGQELKAVRRRGAQAVLATSTTG